MRVPVHFVCGAQALAWASRLQAARPDWAVCDPGGCPCCTGRVALQVALVRLLRAQRPARVLVVVADAAHAQAACARLGEAPLSNYVEAARTVRLPQDEALSAQALERS